MATETQERAQASDTADGAYYDRQSVANQPFRSPFLMLNVTAHDCATQIADNGITAAELERDKAIFQQVIDGYLAEHGYPATNEKVDFVLSLAIEFVNAGMRDARYPRNHWPLIACHAALVTLQQEQQKKTFRVDAAMTNVALFAQAMMNMAWRPKRMQSLEAMVSNSIQASNEIHGFNGALNAFNKALAPLAKKGSKFKPGRPKGSLGRTAKRIKDYLAKHPRAKTLELWGAFSARPEKDYIYCHSPHLGRYIETTGGETVMEWKRFSNLVSQHRPRNK